MKIVIIFAMLVLCLGVYPTVGFLPTKVVELGMKLISLSTDSAVTHDDMTRDAILDVAASVLSDNPNPDNEGSSERISALSRPLDEESLVAAYYGESWKSGMIESQFENVIEDVQDANSNVDFGEEKDVAAAHFDGEQFESGQERLITLRQNLVSSIQAENFDVARADTGRLLHALQDFYSHSNWIENGNKSPNNVLGRPNKRLDNVASPTQQTCINCEEKGFFNSYYECQNNIVSSLQRDGILTSGYYGGSIDLNGQEIQKPLGKCSHGGFADSTRDTYAEGGINKDSPYYRSSPHHYLHYEAAAVAQQATVEILQDIRREVNNDQLFITYLGLAVNQAIADIARSLDDNFPGMMPRIRATLQSVNDQGNRIGSEEIEILLARLAELVADRGDEIQSRRAKRQSETLNVHISSETTEPHLDLESTEDMFSSAVSTSSLMPMQLLVIMMVGFLLLYKIF